MFPVFKKSDNIRVLEKFIGEYSCFRQHIKDIETPSGVSYELVAISPACPHRLENLFYYKYDPSEVHYDEDYDFLYATDIIWGLIGMKEGEDVSDIHNV